MRSTFSQLDGGVLHIGTTIAIPRPASGVDTHTIEYWSMDKAYNTEAHHIDTFTVASAERIPPTTTSDAHGPYSGTATITLSAADDPGGSGVARTYFTVDAGPQRTGTAIVVPAPAIGSVTHTIEFWSVDNAGNVETTHGTAVFDVVALPDPTPPDDRVRRARLLYGHSDDLADRGRQRGWFGRRAHLLHPRRR